MFRAMFGDTVQYRSHCTAMCLIILHHDLQGRYPLSVSQNCCLANHVSVKYLCSMRQYLYASVSVCTGHLMQLQCRMETFSVWKQIVSTLHMLFIKRLDSSAGGNITVLPFLTLSPTNKLPWSSSRLTGPSIMPSPLHLTW